MTPRDTDNLIKGMMFAVTVIGVLVIWFVVA